MDNESFHILKRHKWSKTIKELCNNKCAYCGCEYDGSLKTRLESHHIKQKALYPELELAAENGIALCHVCHYRAHDGCYQAFLTNPHFHNPKLIMKKSGEVYEFTQRAFDTTLFYSSSEYEEIAAAATAAGESVNGYIKKAVDMRMEAES